MAKFFGNIGYTIATQTKPGVWAKTVTPKPYRGDLVNQKFQRQSSDDLNDNLNIANDISIIADKFAYDNFKSMTYVEFMGAKWKIKSAEVKYPRIILSIGGLYNGS